MAQLFTILYPFVAFIAISAYLPQIISLWKLDKISTDISLSSWGMWAVSASISLGYGVFCLKDFMFCLVTGLGLVMIFIVIALVLHNRYIRFARTEKIKSDRIGL